MNKYLLTAYNILGPVCVSETTAINNIFKVSILRQLTDKCNTNINKIRKCPLVINPMQRDKIG